jgi:3',5'-cyclic-AMP phosphodiesterase
MAAMKSETTCSALTAGSSQLLDRTVVRVEVFAVEDTSVQVCWDHAPPGDVTITAGDASSVVQGCGGPGGAIVEGIPCSTTVEVAVSIPGSAAVGAGRVTTLAPPPGRRLSRFAAVNDLHLGARSFGSVRPIWNDDPADPPPLRCARAAVAEALAWGAEAVVVKGDLTQRGRPSEWEAVGALLAAARVPVLVIEGNHETKQDSVDGTAILAGHGITLTTIHPTPLDLPGVRIVGLPTAVWHSGRGHVEESRLAEAAALTHATPGGAGAVVALHHYPQRFRYPTLYPAGIPGRNAGHVLDTLAAAHPATLVLAGHSHRHRRHSHGSLTVAETGSTKDFPGSWSGYTVHEGGILQTTRRVMDPAAMAWTERGRRVLDGVWGVWAAGFRSHRCFVYPWPAGP